MRKSGLDMRFFKTDEDDDDGRIDTLIDVGKGQDLRKICPRGSMNRPTATTGITVVITPVPMFP